MDYVRKTEKLLLVILMSWNNVNNTIFTFQTCFHVNSPVVIVFSPLLWLEPL